MGNSKVNDKGKIHGGGSPKPTNMGKSLAGDATNCIPGTKATTRPLSPSANAASITPQKGK